METPAPATPAAPTARAGRRPRDMVISMVVLLVPVFLFVGLYKFLGNDTPPTIDVVSTYDSARRAKAFPVLTPQDLPDGWRISNASFRDRTLRIGVTSPDDGAMQIVESARSVDVLLPAEWGSGAKAGGTFDVDGVSWQRFTDGRPGERAVVLATPGRTIMIVGKADDAELRTLATSLR